MNDDEMRDDLDEEIAPHKKFPLDPLLDDEVDPAVDEDIAEEDTEEEEDDE